MSDMDSTLAHAADAAYGSSVIDTQTNVSITPDTRPGPNQWRPDEDHFDARERDDAMSEELADAWDNVQARESETPPMPTRPGETIEGRVERAWDHVKRVATKDGKAQAGLENQAHNAVQQIIDTAKEFNIKIQNDDGTIDPIKLDKVREYMGLTNGSRDAAPSEALKAFAPDAKTQSEAEQKVLEWATPYKQIEADYQQRGPRAILDAAYRLGHNSIIDLNNPIQAAHAAAAFHGYSLSQLAQQAGYVPVEMVQQYLDQHANPETIGANAVVEQWCRGKPDVDDEMRREMGMLMTKNPRFLGQQGESDFDVLNRAYERVQRDRLRRGYSKKSKIDRSIESAADKAYGDAA